MSSPVPAATFKPSTQKRLLRALAGGSLDRPPIWLMRQAGRYLPEYRALREKAGSFLALCYAPDLAAEVTLQPVRRFGTDAAILFADILLVADALGQRLDFREGEGPVLEPVRGLDDLVRLGRRDPQTRLAPVYETVSRVRAALPGDCALIGFAGAPWTVATYMVEGGANGDHACAKRWAYGDPAGFQRLIDLLVETTFAYLDRQIAAGAEAVQIFDSWAGALSAEGIERWCVAPVAALVTRLRAAHPDVPVIVFPRGAGALYQGFAPATGAQGIGIDFTVPARWAADVLQKEATVQGNLDPQLLVVGGETMRRAAHQLLETLGHGPYIFNLGHGVVPETPPEHVADLVGLVRNWRA